MNDPWTWTTVWELTVGMDCGSNGWAGWRRAKGENWGNYNRKRIKIFQKVNE